MIKNLVLQQNDCICIGRNLLYQSKCGTFVYYMESFSAGQLMNI